MALSTRRKQVTEAPASDFVASQVKDSPGRCERTDVGLIPAEWTVATIGQVATVRRGASPRPIENPIWFARDSRVGWLRISDVTATVKYLERTTQKLSAAGRAHSRFVASGGLVMSMAATIGRPIITHIDVCIHDGFVVLTQLRADKEYLYYALCSIETNWSKLGQTGSQMNLNTSLIKSTPLPIPPKAEQRAIAEALSDMDRLLNTLGALIGKKRAMRHAAMQQLLTGKTRLQGFTGEWTTNRLGDFVSFLRHGTNSRAELSNAGSVSYLHYGDIHTSGAVRLDPQTTTMPRLAADRARTLDRLQDGDLVLVDVSEDLDGVGKSVEIAGAGGAEIVAGLHTIAARFDKAVLADGFKAYLQFCPAFRDHLKRLAAGTKVYATNRAHVASVEMALPSVEEQIAIASVLSGMNADIAALEGRREKTRAIKQGMMQQLLTGRIRLIEPTSVQTAAC